jgi:malonate decarboxylase delta subunit
MNAMESLTYEYTGKHPVAPFSPVIVGVVGSGNLEVLLEATSSDHSTFHVETSARGFDVIWEAVLRDFHDRHQFAGLNVSINDMGATPAVVSLRLDQAAAGLKELAS